MLEPHYLGAYWGSRAESVEACAHRLADWLAALARIDPLLASWFSRGRSRKQALARPVDPTPRVLREMLLAGRDRRDDRSVITELGFAAGMWNGQDPGVGLSVHCGAPLEHDLMASNTVVLNLPRPEDDAHRLYRRDTAQAIVHSVITTWHPTTCTWSSTTLRQAQDPHRASTTDVVVGWSTYLADPTGVHPDLLPADATADPLETGLLITAPGNADSPPRPPPWPSAKP